MNQTLAYYNQNAEQFIKETAHANMSEMQTDFLSYIPAGGRILDIGCGSGRDSKLFLDFGYTVVSVDGSVAMCKATSERIGKPVICRTFEEYQPQGTFDGIWACASLLHLQKETLSMVIQKLFQCLRKDGCFYMSFKYGDFVGERNGRFFTDLTEESFTAVVHCIKGIKQIKTKITNDVRPEKRNEKWLNIYLFKS